MRAIWSGSLTFGLVNIPVKMYSAVKDQTLKFRLLRKKDFCPISYAKVCRADGNEVPYEDIVRGYEYAKGEYVLLDEEDFAKADAHKTKAIDVVQFTDAGQVDEKYFVKPYYLEPDKRAAQAYALFREALKKSKRVGVVTFVIRNREHVGVVSPENDMLVLQELRYADEVRSFVDLELPGKTKVAEKEMKLALMLIDQLTRPFDIEEYHDTYTEALERMIDQKIKGRKPKKVGKEPVPTAVPDLMAVLEQSLTKSR